MTSPRVRTRARAGAGRRDVAERPACRWRRRFQRNVWSAPVLQGCHGRPFCRRRECIRPHAGEARCGPRAVWRCPRRRPRDPIGRGRPVPSSGASDAARRWRPSFLSLAEKCSGAPRRRAQAVTARTPGSWPAPSTPSGRARRRAPRSRRWPRASPGSGARRPPVAGSGAARGGAVTAHRGPGSAARQARPRCDAGASHRRPAASGRRLRRGARSHPRPPRAPGSAAHRRRPRP
jgi:hypothetical protein